MIIYMNQNNNIMTFKLNTHEVNQVKNLIFDYIDRIGGYNQLSDEMKAVLKKLSEKKAPEVL